MYLEMIKAFVTVDLSPLREGSPQLQVKAWLRCPHCASIANFTAAAIHLTPQEWLADDRQTDNLILGYRYKPIQELKQNRVCEICGVFSGWPKKDQELGEKALSRQISLEWLQRRVRALESAVPYQAKLKDSVKRRIAKDIERERLAMGIE